MFGPATDQDVRRWQTRDAHTLVDLISDSAKHDLPPLAWRVALGGLVGEVVCDFDDRQATFDRWAEFLGAVRRPEGPHVNGMRRLWAVAEQVGKRRAKVGIIANLLPAPCPSCDGDGDTGSTPCTACDGTGNKKGD